MRRQTLRSGDRRILSRLRGAVGRYRSLNGAPTALDESQLKEVLSGLQAGYAQKLSQTLQLPSKVPDGQTFASQGAGLLWLMLGEPVQAHRETVAERAARLFRRYQTAIILVLTYLAIRFLFLALRGV